VIAVRNPSEVLGASDDSVLSWRNFAAFALSALILAVALHFALWGAVIGMFGGLLALAILLVTVVLATALISVTLSGFTGRRNLPAAITATLVAHGALGIAIFGFGTVPVIWVPPGFDLIYVLIAVPCTLMLGLFLGGWRTRVIGACGALILAIGSVWILLPEPEPAGLSQAELQRDANFEGYIGGGLFPMVADVPGGRIAAVLPNAGPDQTLNLTADGGVIEVTVDRGPIVSNPAVNPCWYLSDGTVEVTETDTLEDYASWCVRDQDEWRLVDGTGYARMDGGTLIAVKAALDQHVDVAGGNRPASASEVQVAWDTLRLMTEAEVREFKDDWN
jgi:hypothetical protein